MKVIQPIIVFLFTYSLFLNAAYAQEHSDASKMKQDIQMDTMDFVIVADEAPLFPGCTDSDKVSRRACATKKMLNYIYKDLKYPTEAAKTGIEGTVVIGFIVTKTGSLHNFKFIRKIGGGCDEEAMRVIKSMPNWEPAIHEGQAVNVKFNIPIKFKLEKNTSTSDKPYEKEVFVVVEKMPRFPGCNESDNEKDLKCATKLMNQYVYDNLVYPNLAIENKVEGTVVVQFIVTKSGELINPKCIRDIGAGCGEEAVRLVKSMPTWIPGAQRGTNVDVRYSLPFEFKIGKKKKSRKK